MNQDTKIKLAVLEIQRNSCKPYKELLPIIEKALKDTDGSLKIGIVKSSELYTGLKEIISKFSCQPRTESSQFSWVELSEDNINLVESLDLVVGNWTTDEALITQKLQNYKDKTLCVNTHPNCSSCFSYEAIRRHQKLAWQIIDELSREIEKENKELKYKKEILEDLLKLVNNYEADPYWQSPKDNTVYKVTKPNGTFVEYKDIGYLRTRRSGEKIGTLSLTEVKEKGFGINKQEEIDEK